MNNLSPSDALVSQGQTNGWSVVKYGKKNPKGRSKNSFQHTFVLPVSKKDAKQFNSEIEYKQYLQSYLKLQLPNYGNFKNIEEATLNLYFNMHAGLTPKDMSKYEKALLEYKYGSNWESKLGY